MMATGKRPILIAHRGARREAPENTIPAFKRALEMGADGIEFDVLLTANRVPIVTHNDDLGVLTGFHGKAQSTLYQTIKSLDAGSHFNPSFAGTTIPLLEEVLDLIKDYWIIVIIEIKAQSDFLAEAPKIVGDIVNTTPMKGDLMISSFSPRIIGSLRRHHPRIKRAFTFRGKAFSFFQSAFFARFEGLYAIHPSFQVLTQGLVESAHEGGRQVQTWTVNNTVDFDKCIALGVDGVITDDIALGHL